MPTISTLPHRNAVHCEGGYYGTLFGILFWDIIFMSLPNVFISQYQSAPLDFATDAFYHKYVFLVLVMMAI